MADYQEIWNSPGDATVIAYRHTVSGSIIPLDESNKDYQTFLTWQAAGGVADPAFTTPEIDAAALETRQADRLASLKNALVWQFKMILEIFNVGKTKGLWINTDFAADIRAKAAEWIQTIEDYDNEV
jgi:hypothetical protein